MHICEERPLVSLKWTPNSSLIRNSRLDYTIGLLFSKFVGYFTSRLFILQTNVIAAFAHPRGKKPVFVAFLEILWGKDHQTELKKIHFKKSWVFQLKHLRKKQVDRDFLALFCILNFNAKITSEKKNCHQRSYQTMKELPKTVMDNTDREPQHTEKSIRATASPNSKWIHNFGASINPKLPSPANTSGQFHSHLWSNNLQVSTEYLPAHLPLQKTSMICHITCDMLLKPALLCKTMLLRIHK